LLKKILALLTPREKRRGALILVMVTGMAALEIAGVASVMPFLSVLGNPEVVRENDTLAAVYHGFGFASVDAFLMALGIAAFALILFAAVFRSVTHYAMNRFIEMRRQSVGKRLLETYLRQPYAFFLNRHSGDLAKSILSEVDQLVMNVILPAVELVAYGVVLLGLVGLLVAIDPLLAAAVTAVLGGVYGAIYAAARGVLGRIGRDRVHANLQRFHSPAVRFARHMAINQTVAQVPNFLVEAIAFGGIIAVTLGLLAARGGVQDGGLGGLLPVLGLYAFAGFAGLRMKPAAQKVYQGLSKLRFGAGAVDAIHADLCQRQRLAELHRRAPAPLTPQRAIALADVHYAYPGTEQDALSGINLQVPMGTSVGLVGSTGAGKTTLVDVLFGLLRPTHGAILVDGEPVTDGNLRAYQQALGYVPQEIFLTDASVAETIALDVPPEYIDHEQVVRCARMAQVQDFIMEELPQQYATVVGERGVRLSGGQRQRIGIARALYHDPSVLVFDEATSALDTVTEQAVMEAIEALHHQKTVILTAHRLSTVRKCDQVVLLEKGQVTAAGEFKELQKQSEQFRAMAASSS